MLYVERVEDSHIAFAQWGHPLSVGRRHDRIGARVGTLRIEELVRAFGTVADGHAIAGRTVSPTLQLQVEPHAELARYLIIYHFRTLQNAATLDVGPSLVGDRQCHTQIPPVDEVFRSIAHHPYHRARRGIGLVLTKPIVGIAVFHDTSTMGIDMPAAVVEPQFTALDVGWLRLAGPVALQALGLGLGDVDDRPMLGRHKIGGLHHPLVETSERLEGLEVAGLDESEVMGSDAVDIVHDDPLVLTDALPYVWSLTTTVLRVYLLSMVIIEMVDLVGNHVLDATRAFLCHIRHEVSSVRHRTDIGIERLDFIVGILEEQLRLGLQGGEGLVGIAVVQLGACARLLADGEIHHRLIDGRVPDGLRRPGTSYFTEFLGEEFVDTGLMMRPVNQVF